MKKNCVIGQSGGPTAVINASLAGVAAAALASPHIGRVLGMVNGVQGLMEERFVDMGELLKETGQVELLKTTPAAYLGSCRFRLPDMGQDAAVYETIFNLLDKYHIGYVFYIGGNDSMDTVHKLDAYARAKGKEVQVIGVPKTIDNDLPETDHTPGYGSAAKYIAASLREIGMDSAVYCQPSVTVVEIMGRNAGWLTAASALARGKGYAAPHLIYLPEVPFADERFLADLEALQKQGVVNIVVAVSEGIRYGNGVYVCEDTQNCATDVFGHKNLSGVAKILEQKVKAAFGIKARGVELNVLQRCGGHFASLTDVDEAFAIGWQSVRAAERGASGVMMVYVRESDDPYRIQFAARDIGGIANGEKLVPRSWINQLGNGITKEFLYYAQPLILGEPEVRMDQGLPVYLSRQQ